MSLVGDRRARQYWDGGDWLGDAYGRVLHTPGPAWDVYLLYARGRSWTGTLPPSPDYWMQQLAGVTTAPHLDPGVLYQRVEQLLRG